MRIKDRKVFFDASLLLAEDDPVNADIATRTLQKMGCSVAVASNGLSAIQLWQQRPFDLVLMDCEMAEMDGFDAARRIRQQERSLQKSRTPIVALTAHAPAEVKDRCLAAGMDDVLAKPFKETLLAQALSRWTGQAAPVAANDAAPRPQPKSSASAVDRSVLESITAFQGRSGNLVLKDIVARFRNTARNQLDLLRQSHEAGKIDDILRIAHTLKSSSASLGAHHVSQCCQDIEAAKGDLSLLSHVMPILERALKAALNELQHIVGEREELYRAAG
jgi:CheY-like chemotaxis protein/HPt (histidine-containing phosphotransfer) domain-containing protein